MLTQRLSRQRGVSLVELMVGIVVSLLIAAAAGSTYIATSRTGRDAINSARLNVEMRSAMDVMVDEIRRAGHSALGGTDNPFMAPGAVLTVSGGDCLEFSYDHDADGVLDVDEYMGFRVVGGVIQMRDRTLGGGVASCASNAWEPLTDVKAVTISQQSPTTPYFTVTYQCQNSETAVSDTNRCVAGGTVFDQAAAGTARVFLIETRTVDLQIAGRLTNDATMRMELGQRIHVRNHRTVAVP